MGKVFDGIDDTLAQWIGLDYQRERNARSIDDLPAVELPAP